MNAQYARHGLVKTRLLYALMLRLGEIGGSLNVYSEVSLRVSPDSMPEPDLFLAPQQGFGPVAVAGVALVVEVSDTTLALDLGRKADLYAAAGVPEYWAVDLNGGRVVRHDGPGEEGCRRRFEIPLGEVLRSATIDRLEIPTTELMG